MVIIVQFHNSPLQYIVPNPAPTCCLPWLRYHLPARPTSFSLLFNGNRFPRVGTAALGLARLPPVPSAALGRRSATSGSRQRSNENSLSCTRSGPLTFLLSFSLSSIFFLLLHCFSISSPICVSAATKASRLYRWTRVARSERMGHSIL